MDAQYYIDKGRSAAAAVGPAIVKTCKAYLSKIRKAFSRIRPIASGLLKLMRKTRVISKRRSRTGFKSLRFRISALFIVTLGVILLTYSAALYLSLTYAVYHQVDKELAVKVEGLEDTIEAYNAFLGPRQEDKHAAIERALFTDDVTKAEIFSWPTLKKVDKQWQGVIADTGLKYDYIVILNPLGDIINRSSNAEDFIVDVLKKNIPEAVGSKPVIKNYISGNLKLRIMAKSVSRNNNPQYMILLATSLEPLLFILKNKIMHFFIIIPFVLLIAVFLSGFFVKRVLDPIGEITRTADNISHRDMSKRIEQRYKDAEIRLLVKSFNHMISRLEEFFKHIDTFSSNVAHELKTPLAIIRGEAEVVLRKKRVSGEYERVVRVNLEESKRMLKTIDDLLLLSKLDHQPQNFKFEDFDVSEFFGEICEQAQLLAMDKKIDINLDILSYHLSISGNRLQLRRLFLNLINNAIKFTPKNGSIDIVAKQEDGKLTVSISDTGIGIAKEDLPRVFDRFYHRDVTGWNMEPANGLGLSIVQSILNIHEGGIEVKSELGKGSVFTIRLPLSKSAAHSINKN